MDQPPLPSALPSAVPAKKQLSTGCIISMIVVSILVPILVIGVLAAMAVPVLQARAVARALSIAIEGFQTEYNHPPLPKDQVVLESTTIPSSGPLVDALIAEDNVINPRKVKFYDPRIARKNANGILEKDGKRTVLDPWGQPYFILLDLDGDGKIPDPEHPGMRLDTRAGVFSAGPDGDPATWQDNVKSWKK